MSHAAHDRQDHGHARHGASPAHTATDPVCGMKVDPHTARHRAEHEGRPYYFCCAGCREKFVAARVDLVSTVNVLGYTAAYAAYRDGEPWLDELLRYLEANRDFAIDYARTRLPGVRVAAPEATYLAWLDCRNAGTAAGDPFTFFLDKARVALSDGVLFGPGGEGLVRLNFGCPRAMMMDGLARMRAAIATRPWQ